MTNLLGGGSSVPTWSKVALCHLEAFSTQLVLL